MKKMTLTVLLAQTLLATSAFALGDTVILTGATTNAITILPFATSEASTEASSGYYKELMVAAKEDAVAYLNGAQKSQVLQAAFDEIQKSSPGMSEEEMAEVIISVSSSEPMY